MTHLNIAEAVHAKTKELLALLPAETAAAQTFTESQDIAVAFNELAAICMTACVGNAENAAALEEAYQNDSLTDANAVAKFLDAFIQLDQKANPTHVLPEEPEDEGPGD